jgi:hypothetical protein
MQGFTQDDVRESESLTIESGIQSIRFPIADALEVVNQNGGVDEKTGPNDTGTSRLSGKRRIERSICTFTTIATKAARACSKGVGPLHRAAHARSRVAPVDQHVLQRDAPRAPRVEADVRPACRLLANNPCAGTGLFASRLPPDTGTPCLTE